MVAGDSNPSNEPVTASLEPVNRPETEPAPATVARMVASMATGLSLVFTVALWARAKVPRQRTAAGPSRRIVIIILQGFSAQFRTVTCLEDQAPVPPVFALPVIDAARRDPLPRRRVS